LLAVLAMVTASATEAAKAQGMSAPPAPSAKGQRSDADAIRPFSVHVPDEALTDLGRRLAATRWPDRETVSDRSQGAPLDDFKELVRYWGTGYDWRRGEAKLDALPQFVTSIDGLDIHFIHVRDGLDIHFIHVRSRHPNALPVILTHGWPGSVFEFLKTIG